MIFFIVLTIMIVAVVFLVFMVHNNYIHNTRLLDWKDISIEKIGYFDYIISFTDGYGIKRSCRGSCPLWYDVETAAKVENYQIRIKLNQIWRKEEWKHEEHKKS